MSPRDVYFTCFIQEARSGCEWKFVRGRSNRSRLYGRERFVCLIIWVEHRWIDLVFDQSRVHVAATESSFTFRAELLNGQKSFYRQPCEISHCPEVCDACVCARECVFVVSRGFLSRRLHWILALKRKNWTIIFWLTGLISVKWNFEALLKVSNFNSILF